MGHREVLNPMFRLRNKHVGTEGIPSRGNGGAFAKRMRGLPTERDDLSSLKDRADSHRSRYLDALEGQTLAEIHERFPEVHAVVFEDREFTEVIPYVEGVYDKHGAPVDSEVADIVANDIIYPIDDRDFGDRVEGRTLHVQGG